MNKPINVSGKVVHKDLDTGFWGIIGDDGQEWLPINLPPSMQVRDKRVRVKVKIVEGGMSMFMWGTLVEIVS